MLYLLLQSISNLYSAAQAGASSSLPKMGVKVLEHKYSVLVQVSSKISR